MLAVMMHDNVSRTDCMHEEIRAGEQRTREDKDAHQTGGVLDAPDYFCVSDDDPKDIADAMRQPDWSEWQLSMGNELASLRAHDVWTLIPRDQVPIGKHIILLKFMLQYKLDEHGKICRRKSRVVAKGFAQGPGIDFNETYTPVA